MKRKIDAFVLKRIKSNLKLEKNIFIPKLKKGQIFAKIIYTSLCKSQIMEIKGSRGKDKYIPHALGHEGLAEVIDIGANVKKVKIGDKIILSWIKSKGMNCGGFKIKLENNTNINFGPITTLSNYTLISENRCVKKPKGLDDKLAAFFGCSVSTGFGVVYNVLKKENKKKSIGIYGLGSVGFFSLLAVKCLGFKKIFVIEKNKEKRKLLKKMKIEIIDHQNSHSEIKKKNNNQLLDYCFESAGYARTIENAFSLINNRGSCYTSSHPDYKEKIKINPHDLIKGKRLFGSWGGYTNPDKDFNIYNKLISKEIKLMKYMKIKEYKFEDINKAINDFSKNKIIKPLIRC